MMVEATMNVQEVSEQAEVTNVEQKMKEAISQCEQHIDTVMASREPVAKIALSPIKNIKFAEEEEPNPIHDAFGALGIFRAVKKRTRSVLSPYQHSILHREFLREPFPSKVKREALGKSIGCSQRTIQIWFQNQRQKNRQGGQVMKNVMPMATPSHPSRSVPLYTMPMVMPANGMMYHRHFNSNPPSPTLSYEKGEKGEIFEGLNALVNVAMAELANLAPKDPRLMTRPTLQDLLKVAPPSLKSINFIDERLDNGSNPIKTQANDLEREHVIS